MQNWPISTKDPRAARRVAAVLSLCSLFTLDELKSPNYLHSTSHSACPRRPHITHRSMICPIKQTRGALHRSDRRREKFASQSLTETFSDVSFPHLALCCLSMENMLLPLLLWARTAGSGIPMRTDPDAASVLHRVSSAYLLPKVPIDVSRTSKSSANHRSGDLRKLDMPAVKRRHRFDLHSQLPAPRPHQTVANLQAR